MHAVTWCAWHILNVAFGLEGVILLCHIKSLLPLLGHLSTPVLDESPKWSQSSHLNVLGRNATISLLMSVTCGIMANGFATSQRNDISDTKLT